MQKLLNNSTLQHLVKQVLLKGELVEEYADDYPFPSALFLGFTDNKTPIHVVAAVDSETNWCYIVTAYKPNSEYFESDFKTRKK